MGAPGERSMISTIVYAGGPCGTTVSLLITGYLSASTSGWPMSFYFFNGLGLIWTVYFSFFGYNTPADHSSITKEERGYIEESLGRVQNKRKQKFAVLRRDNSESNHEEYEFFTFLFIVN
ncbi:hypothetical protein JTB14_014849 [Gonioctena quinquepunctata]|nr:hypothetical protein JTB14_014849 [Gonioctena quinquepunctata]